jgi:hypothetical protein
MRRTGIKQIVGEGSEPWQSLGITAQLVEQLGPGKAFMELDKERRVAILVSTRTNLTSTTWSLLSALFPF